MQFPTFIPEDPEAEFYANHCTIDSGGVDVTHFGETISASFEGQDLVDIALSVLNDDFSHLEDRARQVLLLGAVDTEGLETLGYIYLRAAQMRRANKEASLVGAA